MLIPRRLLSVAAATLSLTIVGTTAAFAATTTSWFFGEVVPGQAVQGDQAFTDNASLATLWSADTTTLTGRNLDAQHSDSVYFPGWQGVVAGGTVSKTASMLSSDRTFEQNTNGGVDGGSNAFDPESGNFKVSAWVLPDNPADFTAGGALSAISPNIVQKGLSATTGGFWKMSMSMLQTGGVKHWFPFCEFKNGTIDLKPGWDSQLGRFSMAVGTAYKVECVKAGAAVTLNVYTGGQTPVFTKTRTHTANFSIANTLAVSVGHKPKSTDPHDVYAGVIDNLVITKG